MPKQIKEYEWNNRLGTIAYQLNIQATGLRNFKQMFEGKFNPVQIELADRISNSIEQVSTMVRELEDELN